MDDALFYLGKIMDPKPASLAAAGCKTIRLI